MIQRPSIDDSQELDRFVAALEDAYRQAKRVELATLSPPADHPLFHEIVRELVRVDIELRAGCSEQVDLDFYQTRFPTLFVRRDDLEAVAYEDYRQRQLAGEHPRAEDYHRRWNIDISGWPSQDSDSRGASELVNHLAPTASSLVDSLANNAAVRSRVVDPAVGPEPPSTQVMPRVGEKFLGFELLALLGRGAFAKVYLARQGELADRPVALKITRRSGSEPQTLARLQHTNIVPIYSVHRGGTFQAVCMPYCGGVTLADAVRELRQRIRQPASGRALVETVLANRHSTPWHDTEVAASLGSSESCSHDSASLASNSSSAANAVTALNTLSGLTYVEAVLWIGAQLAAGLAHAHERGILHRDLKPANVLLASDGQPMLLDFNLSQDRNAANIGRSAHVGGTLPYMAPEILRAFQVSMSGGDERSDIYSLGLVLYEVLTGEYPFPLRHGEIDQLLVDSLADRKTTIRSPRQINPAITPAIEAMVLRCLEYDPARRYRSAQELHEDLQCQLQHRPLRHTREPSLVERSQKWFRRHPRLASSSGVAGIAAMVLMFIGALLVARNAQVARFEAVQQLASLETTVQQAQVALVDVMHDQPQAEATLKKLLAEISTAGNRNKHGQLDARGSERWNTARAEAQFLKTTYASRQTGHSPSDVRREPDVAPAKLTARDLGHRAALLSSERRFAEARTYWERLTQADPKNVWGWYGLGHCCERLGMFDVAAECYSACIALAPEQPQWHFRRGLCHLQRQQSRLASQDFSTVL
ncbi:MAG: protein kinase, partial [Planctomycetaceae bacterium]|nr:protein kinase [Planctomycetaceae bacterium]